MLSFILRSHREKTLVGYLLLMATAAALLCENSSWRTLYHAIVDSPIHPLLTINLHEIINEGLLVIFFFLIGLEVKYEIVAGNLQTFKSIMHPAVAALGGVLVPALIYVFFNLHTPDTQAGWAIPTATDIAFAVGILSLGGNKVPHVIKTLLVTIAIFDDILAIVIIAIFYSDTVYLSPLLITSAAIVGMRALVKWEYKPMAYYIIPAVIVWISILYSGIHTTISGFIIALCLPSYAIQKNTLNTKKLIHTMEPWVNYIILPVFALANAGVYVLDIQQSDLINPVSRGIMLGLLLGKPIGICALSYAYRFISSTQLPDVKTKTFVAMSFLCGIGFTMSLFIGNLAFEHSNPEYIRWVKIGVLRGSFIAGLIGLLLLKSDTFYTATKEEQRDG